MINPFGIVSTVVLFKVFEKYKNLPVLKPFPPLLVTGICLIFILKIFDIDYEIYNQSASWLTFLLIPATISLGYPLYRNLNMLVKNKRIIYTAFFVSMTLALLSTFLIGKLCHTDMSVILSMLPKSVTAPIAVEISKNLHGVPELTACFVALTGIFGALTGHKILKWIRVKNDIAIGLSMGAASHVIATSKCIETGHEKQVVMSTLALVLVGIITAIFAPLLLLLLRNF